MRAKILILILLTTLSLNLMGQSVIKPAHAFWKADQTTISLDKAYNIGIEKPNELEFTMFFDIEFLKEQEVQNLDFEIIWFYFYSTEKEYMDSYTIKYDEKNINKNNKYEIKSKIKNMQSGWWEVVVKSKYDNKDVRFNKVNKFQIYLK